MCSTVADHCSYKKVHLQCWSSSNHLWAEQLQKFSDLHQHWTTLKPRQRMKFFIVFSTLLVLAAAWPSSYVMKQEKENPWGYTSTIIQLIMKIVIIWLVITVSSLFFWFSIIEYCNNYVYAWDKVQIAWNPH